MSARTVRAGELQERRRVLLAELETRAVWFVRVRWWVVPGTIISVLLARVLRIELAVWPVLAVAGFILLYNYGFHLWSRRLRRWPAAQHEEELRRFARCQVGLDYVCMFVWIHLTGGMDSPLVFFFIFHIIFAALLLRRRTALILASLVGAGMALLTVAEQAGWLPHRPLLYAGRPPPPAAGLLPLLVTWAMLTASLLVSTLVTAHLRQMIRARIYQLAGLAVDNARAYEALEEAGRARERFTFRVAHHLRAPLAAMVSMMDVLRDGHLGELSEPQREYVRRVMRRARSLTDTVNGLLVLGEAQSDRSRAAPTPLPWPDLAGRLRRTFQDRAAEKNLSLTVQTMPAAVLQGDPAQLERLLENLISNAIKYTPAGGRVEVTAEAAGVQRVRLRVSDTGIGIPQAARPRLFDEFYRAENARRQDEEGTGLGLAIAREIVRGHGGTITVQSQENKGSTFLVELPAADPLPSVEGREHAGAPIPASP